MILTEGTGINRSKRLYSFSYADFRKKIGDLGIQCTDEVYYRSVADEFELWFRLNFRKGKKHLMQIDWFVMKVPDRRICSGYMSDRKHYKKLIFIDQDLEVIMSNVLKW